MKTGAYGRLWSAGLLTLTLAVAACNGSGGTSQGVSALPMPPSDLILERAQSSTPLTKGYLCERLIHGEYGSKKVDHNCSFVPYKTEMNVGVCDDPSDPHDCTGIPDDAILRLTEADYKGKITAGDVTTALPAKIRESPWFISGLCGDKHKSPSQDPSDKIGLSPAHDDGPVANFRIKDYGSRSKYGTGSSTCQVLFYDDVGRFVETLVVMVTP